MRAPTQEPTIVKNNTPMGGEDYSHPAYGDISASRTSGHMNLYGSEFHHNGYITIRINHAKFSRSLSRDWHHSQGSIVEVALSESQWAHFVSSLNSGGTQCTLNRIGRESVPELPSPPNRQEQFDKELKEMMANSKIALKNLADKIESLKLSEKMKKELIGEVIMAERGIGSSAKFVAESFSEHMEEQTERAKCEVNAYMEGQIRRVGLEHIKHDGMLLNVDARDCNLGEERLKNLNT